MFLKMRVYHRYLGFFLAGIMAVYAISGMVLIFRDKDTFKKVTEVNKTLDAGLTEESLGRALEMRRFKVDSTSGDMLFFRDGQYNSATGEATYLEKELPYVLEQMTELHKSRSSMPLSFLNMFFAISLLFFVISSFWMFFPGSAIFKKGLYFSLAGLVLALILIFI